MTSPSVLEPLDGLGALLPTAREPQARWPALPWPARLLETLSSYLPLLLMGLLALGSWWLVKNTPLPEAARPLVTPRHEPDYTMHQFSIQRFTPEGPLRAQIEGDALRHYPDTDTFEIDRPRVNAFAQDGGLTYGSARRALSNADATEVQLLGDAQVTRVATASGEGMTFRGEFLHAFLKTEQVRSHLPATVTRGGTVIRADAFSYDNLDRTVSLTGRVRASFPAPGVKAGPGTRPGSSP
jgi:lipopolysaccharide export system protein LptC